jgi:hypothetical protein
MTSFTRRHFLSGSTTAAASLFASRISFAQDPVIDATGESARGVREKIAWQAEPFPLADVRLLPGLFYDQQEINRAYLHSLDNDSLLWSFRKTAGLPNPGTPYGGWEAPDCELRGHFNGGHYLSAVALTYAGTGDEALRDKGNALVIELAKCQAANANGYLSAYPEDFSIAFARSSLYGRPSTRCTKFLPGISTCISIAEISRRWRTPRASQTGSITGPRASAMRRWRASSRPNTAAQWRAC